MVDPTPPPGSGDPPPIREVIARRLQARFEAYDQEDGGGLPPAVAAPTAPVAPAAARPAAPSVAPGTVGRGAGTLQAQVHHLHQQFAILREQLDRAFDDLEDRVDDLEARVGLAETRASVAEARASVAETRAADAEARATGAHRRVDELLVLLEQLVPKRPLPLEEAPAAGALERLHQLSRQAQADS